MDNCMNKEDHEAFEDIFGKSSVAQEFAGWQAALKHERKSHQNRRKQVRVMWEMLKTAHPRGYEFGEDTQWLKDFDSLKKEME